MRTTRKPAAGGAPPVEPLGDAAFIDAPEDELLQAIGELGESQGVCRIYRQRRGALRPVYVTDIPAHEFTLPYLQQHCGGGLYIVKVLDGNRRHFKQATVEVEGPEVTPGPGPAPSPSMAVTAAPSPLEMMLGELTKSSQAIAAALLQRPAPPDEATIRSRLLEEMKAMREAMGGASALDPTKIVDVLKTGIDLAKDSAGGGEAAGGYGPIIMRAVEILGPQVAELLTAAAGRAAQAPARLPIAPPERGAPPEAREVSPTPAPPASSEVDPVKLQEHIERKLMQTWVPKLVQMAADERDPVLYADLIIDQVPRATVDRLLEGDLIERLAEFDGRVRIHAQWFRDLGQAVREGLSTDVPQPGGPAAADSAPS